MKMVLVKERIDKETIKESHIEHGKEYEEGNEKLRPM